MAENNNETKTRLAVTTAEVQFLAAGLEDIKDAQVSLHNRIDRGFAELPCKECFQRLGLLERQTDVAAERIAQLKEDQDGQMTATRKQSVIVSAIVAVVAAAANWLGIEIGR